ncbi:MAG: hypothetical protein HY318_15975 [Armatimonadetes bacterium]|nr:hypothetical protein [Armatimonadota bacterium]
MAQTEGEPAVLREAKAIAHYYRHQEVIFRDGELLVGTPPGLIEDSGGEITPAVFGRRTWEAPTGWWPVPKEVEPFWCKGMLSAAGNHTTVDYDTIFSVGFAGLIEQINERIARLSPDNPQNAEQRNFLKALQIVAEGYIDLSNRYGDHAEELAQAEVDPDRKAELKAIARNCRRVPAHPPTNFWEACQCVWFSFFFLPDAPGRVDQYLYPCYAREIAEGTLDRDFAQELVCCLWTKYFESAGATSGVSAHNHLTLGGVKPDGSDASNDVTFLCLDVVEELALLRPQVGVRWHKGTPPKLLSRAVRALRGGSGSPDFCSDEQIVHALVNVGVSLEDARDFSLSGCHEVIVTGKAQMGSVEGFINMPMILRMTLGLEPELQRDVDLSTMVSFEDVWSRLVGSMDLVAEAAHRSSVGRDRAAALHPGGNLQASLAVKDCIERACGYTQGGARYNFCNWDVIGTANLADSLIAVRKVVFEEGLLTLSELTETLQTDWEGQEFLRRRIERELPHFGNEDPESDVVMQQIITTLDAILKRRKPYRGGEYILGTTAGGENMHIEYGRVTGATPDGRKRGEPLADSIGSVQGRDRKGLISLLNSVASLPHHLLPTATTLNVKLDPNLLKDEDGLRNVAAIIEAHFTTGGQQLQFTFVNREILLEAKKHPDQYRHLMVRVAGYCAPFTSLWEDLQDEIIARTEHGGC